MKLAPIYALSMGLCLALFSGCSSNQAAVVKAPKVYKIATRKWAPEPVYNRLRWVRPPQVHPARKRPQAEAPYIMPVIHFSVKDETLKDAVLILGTNSRYRTYCSPAIASEKLSLDMLGTIEEIAVAIEDSKNIRVILDHEAQELRFEPRGGEYPTSQGAQAKPSDPNNGIIFSRLES